MEYKELSKELASNTKKLIEQLRKMELDVNFLDGMELADIVFKCDELIKKVEEVK